MQPRRRPALDARLLALIVFAFAGLLYANTLRNDLVWDDRALVVENPDIRTLDWPTVQRLFTNHYWAGTGKPGGLYRPLSALSFYTDYQLYGNDPAGFHATNVLLHAGVCAIAFILFLQVLGGVSTGLTAALLFAAFPPHTENVAWVAGRTDLLATLMMLASLSFYAWWRQRKRSIGLVFSLLAAVAAVLAKEIAVVLPLLIALLEAGPFPRIHSGGNRWTRAALLSLPFVAVAVGFFMVRRHLIGAAMFSFLPFATGVLDVAALSLSIFARYFVQLVFPLRLNAESEFPVPSSFANPATLSGLLLLLALSALVYRYRRRGDVVLAAAVFGVGLLPALNIVPTTEVSADRFLYLPSLGFVLAQAVVVTAARERWRRMTLVCLAVVLAVFSARTVARNFDWHDEMTLFRHTVGTADDNARAHLNLGNALYRDGRYREALAEYTQALEIDPDYAGAWSSAAGAHKALGEIDEAFRCIQRALVLEPTNSNFLNSVGILHVQRKQYREAAQAFELAVKAGPDNSRARYNLGVARFHLADYEGAIRDLNDVPHKDVEFVLAYFYMAESAARLGHTGDARRYANEFLQVYAKDDDFRVRAHTLAAPGD